MHKIINQNFMSIEFKPYKNDKVEEHQQVLEDIKNALHFDKCWINQGGLLPVSSLTDFVT